MASTIPLTDANGDGFVDNWSTYRLTNGSNAVRSPQKGRTFSDSTTASWDAAKAVQSANGWKVLLEGDATYSDQWYVRKTNALESPKAPAEILIKHWKPVGNPPLEMSSK